MDSKTLTLKGLERLGMEEINVPIKIGKNVEDWRYVGIPLTDFLGYMRKGHIKTVEVEVGIATLWLCEVGEL